MTPPDNPDPWQRDECMLMPVVERILIGCARHFSYAPYNQYEARQILNEICRDVLNTFGIVLDFSTVVKVLAEAEKWTFPNWEAWVELAVEESDGNWGKVLQDMDYIEEKTRETALTLASPGGLLRRRRQKQLRL